MKAFSLIELLVVIAIIAIIAAIAVPQYQTYSVRAQVQAGIPTLYAALMTAENTYIKNGGTLTSFSYGGTTFSTNLNPITACANCGPFVSMSAIWGLGSNQEITVCGYYSNLNIPQFSSSTPKYARLCMRATEQLQGASSNFTYRCGQIDGTSTDVPQMYLPSNCQNVIGNY